MWLSPRSQEQAGRTASFSRVVSGLTNSERLHCHRVVVTNMQLSASLRRGTVLVRAQKFCAAGFSIFLCMLGEKDSSASLLRATLLLSCKMQFFAWPICGGLQLQRLPYHRWLCVSQAAVGTQCPYTDLLNCGEVLFFVRF